MNSEIVWPALVLLLMFMGLGVLIGSGYQEYRDQGRIREDVLNQLRPCPDGGYDELASGQRKFACAFGKWTEID